MAKNGNVSEVKTLLNKGADVNAKNNNGNTALMEAADKGHLEVAKLLIQNGADVNAENNDGWTALDYAKKTGRTDVAKLLIQNGADVNTIDNDGNTALLYATDAGHTDIVNLFKTHAKDLWYKQLLESLLLGLGGCLIFISFLGDVIGNFPVDLIFLIVIYLPFSIVSLMLLWQGLTIISSNKIFKSVFSLSIIAPAFIMSFLQDEYFLNLFIVGLIIGGIGSIIKKHNSHSV